MVVGQQQPVLPRRERDQRRTDERVDADVEPAGLILTDEPSEFLVSLAAADA